MLYRTVLTKRELSRKAKLSIYRSMFTHSTNSLDELTEAVTSYISFCEDCCIPTRTRVSFNNDKPWFTAKLRRLRVDKEEAIQGIKEQV